MATLTRAWLGSRYRVPDTGIVLAGFEHPARDTATGPSLSILTAASQSTFARCGSMVISAMFVALISSSVRRGAVTGAPHLFDRFV